MRTRVLKVGDTVDFCNPKTGVWQYLGSVSEIEKEETILSPPKDVYKVDAEKSIKSEFWYAPEQLRHSK